MLDYDGTLAPFVIDRDQAYPYDGITERLCALAQLKNTHIVIISGRALGQLEKLIDGCPGLELWGSHGLESKSEDGITHTHPIDFHSKYGIDLGVKICREYAKPDRIEIKPFAVALHLRGMEPLEAEQLKNLVEAQWREKIQGFDLEIHHFNGGIELRPRSRNKGDVVHALISRFTTPCRAAYLGDDATDEDAFLALGNRGLKVLVSDTTRATLADLQLTPPKEIFAFLDLWISSGGNP